MMKMSAPIIPFDPYLLMLSIAALFIWALFIDEVEKQKNKKFWKIAFYGSLIAGILICYSPILIHIIKYWRNWMVGPLFVSVFIPIMFWLFYEEIKRINRALKKMSGE
jgi:hypothetical protein